MGRGSRSILRTWPVDDVSAAHGIAVPKQEEANLCRRCVSDDVMTKLIVNCGWKACHVDDKMVIDDDIHCSTTETMEVFIEAESDGDEQTFNKHHFEDDFDGDTNHDDGAEDGADTNVEDIDNSDGVSE
ncbi:hypothetical protein PHPALM_5862 [Phytophthora palmivora]|uniref:Uncharacterized protein n=1 Tax=Phytophthora palmivora TaxID=4796 RepID=A0A2P4YGC9_9STRA|nr:hypothetical protein PHPALM_5862 [Phytophthora palmivora]